MRYSQLYLYLFASSLLILTPCAGQEFGSVRTESDSLLRHISREKSAEWSCYFTYAQGKAIFSTEMGNNASELEKLDVFIRQALAHPTLYLSRIRLTGFCSVEGGYARNESLSHQRVEQFYLYFNKQYPQLYHYPKDLAWVAEDWSGLSKQIRKSPLKERDDILEIIRKVPVFDTREALLMKLNDGRAWLFMERELFPELRRVELRIEYSTTPIVTASEPYNIKPITADTIASMASPIASPQPSPKDREPNHAASGSISTIPNIVSDLISAASDSLSFGEGRGEAVGEDRVKPVFALKTNLLLLAGVQSDLRHTTPVANAALEYYINDHWSVELGAMYSYWHYNSHREFQGISGYRLEPRYRFTLPHNRFEVYLGLYGRSGDYDKAVESSQLIVGSDNAASRSQRSAEQTRSQLSTINCELSTVNYTGDYFDAGLSAGLSIKLIGRLGLEVGARAGYVMSTNVTQYIRDINHNWYESKTKYHKLRVTDLNVSLVYKLRSEK